MYKRLTSTTIHTSLKETEWAHHSKWAQSHSSKATNSSMLKMFSIPKPQISNNCTSVTLEIRTQSFLRLTILEQNIQTVPEKLPIKATVHPLILSQLLVPLLTDGAEPMIFHSLFCLHKGLWLAIRQSIIIARAVICQELWIMLKFMVLSKNLALVTILLCQLQMNAKSKQPTAKNIKSLITVLQNNWKT